MPLESNTNKILYVPFNNDYIVDDKIKHLMTETEFFNKCFLHTKYEIYEEIPVSNSEESGSAINAQEHYAYIDEQDSAYRAFKEWIKSDENAVYCITGDAGSGKTTYLHYLRYIGTSSNEIWCIIDVISAVLEIDFGKYVLKIKNFNTLYAKAFSSIILKINQIMKINQKDSTYESVCQILKIHNNYKLFSKYDIIDEVDKFFSNELFENLYGKTINDFSDMQQIDIKKEYKRHLFTYFNNVLSFESFEDTLGVLLKLLMILLKCDNSESKFFISFDNFERFIGTDEIFCFEFISFIEYLRHFVDSISNGYDNFGKCFKYIFFVRNTSTRMFTPQQISDFAPHELDITDWFSTKRIIEKKIDWYNENQIEINDIEGNL